MAVGDSVYAGTTNLDGMIHIRVEKEYQDTSFQKIVTLLEDAQQISVPEMRIVDQFMHYNQQKHRFKRYPLLRQTQISGFPIYAVK